MSMHQKILALESTIYYLIRTKSERLRWNMHNSSALIPTRRLGKPPRQYPITEDYYESTIYYQIGTKSERLRWNMHNSSALIPTRRLGKPPCQYPIPKVMIYRSACG